MLYLFGRPVNNLSFARQRPYNLHSDSFSKTSVHLSGYDYEVLKVVVACNILNHTLRN